MRLSPVINFHRHGFFAVMLILVTLSFSAQVDKAAIAGKGDTALAVKKSPADTGTFRDSAKTTAKSDSLKKEKKQDLKDTVHYESDDIDYDAKGRILRLTGHAKVAYQNMKLVADTIVYTMADNLFTANGKPMLIEDKDTTIGDFMVYNIKTKRGRVRTATTHVQDAYFTGQRIMKTKDNELFVAEGEYTTCEFPDTPHYFFYGERIRLKPDDKIISKPVVLNIGDAPVVYLPYFIFPVERNRKSGFLTPIWGGNPAGGGYVDHIGYYWAPNDYYDLTASARVQEFSQFIANASSKYNVRYLLNGGFDAHYTFNSDFLNSQRQWSLDYNHSQTLTPDGLTTLSGRGSLVSTQSFYSTYSMDSNQLIQQDLTANMSYSKQFPDINASLSVDWDRDQNLKTGLITSDMPHVNFSLPDRPLIPLPNQDITSLGGTGSSSSAESDTESRWYNSIYWNYTGQGIVRSNETGSNQPGSFLQPGMQNSLNLSAPQKLFKYIIITPNASATLTTLRGYSDTAVLKIDTVHDTITYTSHSRSDTARYPGYRLLPPITSRIGDTLGEPDTIYSFMVTDSNTIKRYHTDSTKINNI
jgi:lipopolysaccharide export system protein LptA